MTTPVVTVEPSTPFPTLVGLMVEHDISGLPVLDETGAVLGIVTEADLVSKEAHGGRQRSVVEFLGDLVAGGESRWVNRARGRDAETLMTRQLVTIREREDIRAAARQMLDRGVKRLPVLDDDQVLVGILTRTDLLRSLHRDDGEIDAAVRAALDDPLTSPTGTDLRVEARDGVVTLSGTVEFPHDLPTVEAVVWSIPGVVAVDNHATSRYEEPRSSDLAP
ncbi:MAG: CBS domain-containing protein [Acidimicrobiales bacterium]|nr:CBS domain-containing protein [Acidimicrobiales bacterium]